MQRVFPILITRSLVRNSGRPVRIRVRWFSTSSPVNPTPLLPWKLMREHERLTLESANDPTNKAAAGTAEVVKWRLVLWAQVASALVGTLGALGYAYLDDWRKKKQMELGSPRPLIDEMVESLRKPFKYEAKPSHLVTRLRELQRPGQDQLKARLVSDQDAVGLVIHVEGPSASGKSYVVGSLLKQKPGVVWISMRQDEAQAMAHVLGASFGMAKDDLHSKSQSDVQQYVKVALQKFAECKEGKDGAILVLDDIQDKFRGQDAASLQTLLRWALEMANLRLLTLVTISSEPMAPKLSELSGFKERLEVVHVSRVPDRELHEALPKGLDLSVEDSNYLISRLHGHMGDVNKAVIKNKLDRIPIVESVDSVVALVADELYDALVHGHRRTLPESLSPEGRMHWFSISRAIAMALRDGGTEGEIKIKDVMDKLAKDDTQLHALTSQQRAALGLEVAERLQKLNIIRLPNSHTAAWHKPSLQVAIDRVAKQL